MNKEVVQYYQSISYRLNNFCNPLNNYFNLSLFIYFKIFSDESYILLSNDVAATEEYCLGSSYDNIYLHNYLENHQKLILWPENPCSFGTNLVSKLGYGNGLIIVTEETKNIIECCCFLSSKDNFQINELFFKYSDILQKFTNHFKKKNADIINASNKCRARYKNGYDFYLSHEPTNPHDIQSFFSITGIEGTAVNINGKLIYLSKIEKKCLELIAKNFSLKEIGKKLSLTQRVVDIHISAIKDKTGFHYRSDLVEIYLDSCVGNNS